MPLPAERRDTAGLGRAPQCCRPSRARSTRRGGPSAVAMERGRQSVRLRACRRRLSTAPRWSARRLPRGDATVQIHASWSSLARVSRETRSDRDISGAAEDRSARPPRRVRAALRRGAHAGGAAGPRVTNRTRSRETLTALGPRSAGPPAPQKAFHVKRSPDCGAHADHSQTPPPPPFHVKRTTAARPSAKLACS
jgi:hypothetical protein